MKITRQGPLMTKMSDVTALLPFDHVARHAGPSSAKVRMAYPVAKSLLGAKAEIGAILIPGLRIPIKDGSPYGSAVNKPTVKAYGMELRVNQLAIYDENTAVADVTFICPEGVEGAYITGEMFDLVREDWLDMYNSGNIPAGGNNSGGDQEDGEPSEMRDLTKKNLRRRKLRGRNTTKKKSMKRKSILKKNTAKKRSRMMRAVHLFGKGIGTLVMSVLIRMPSGLP